MNLLQIYNALFADKKMELSFQSLREAENFRVRLAKFKRQEDRILVVNEVLDQPARFSFLVREEEQEDGSILYVAIFCFLPALPPRIYDVKIIEDVKILDDPMESEG